ncbi:hypothetical protein BV22DRAFT_742367 [Leucogyrophana mollusca]|uniref:Uncharacterized protein n=1 Tax=Leucogyrophana mollusca TaxID=85980 RepID=A0ACB8B663_9AGAM|nr:hypothetical protein BV22DRAFT_742367 [Leucogyrophana mollusca]
MGMTHAHSTLHQAAAVLANNYFPINFSLTVVGATGLSPSTGFCVVVEVDGKQGQTAELAPSPQSTIEWNACFPLRADKVSYITLRLYECWKLPGYLRGNKVSYIAHRLYECWKTVFPSHLRGDKTIWESRATAEQLLGSDSKFTKMALPAQAPDDEGHLIVKVERAVHTEGERPVVGKSSGKRRWKGALRDLGPSAVCSVHDIARTRYSDFEESHHREKPEEAINHYRISLGLRPPGHPDRSTSLSNLAGTPIAPRPCPTSLSPFTSDSKSSATGLISMTSCSTMNWPPLTQTAVHGTALSTR